MVSRKKQKGNPTQKGGKARAQKRRQTGSRIDVEVCSEVVWVKCKDVKRFDQPRTTFNRRKLEELAAAIRSEGQLTPIEITPDGVLVDGERRLIAIKEILREPRIRAFINHEITGEDERYIRAFSINGNREPHTPLEIAHVIERMIQRGYTREKIAANAGRSEGWVGQYLGLLRLSEEVQALMEPAIENGYYIRFYTCVRLCAISDLALQLKVARHVVRHELAQNDAVAYIASQARKHGFKESGRGRKPSDEHDLLRAFHQRVKTQVRRFQQVDMEVVYARRSYGDVVEMMRNLDQAIEAIQMIRDAVANAKTPGNTKKRSALDGSTKGANTSKAIRGLNAKKRHSADRRSRPRKDRFDAVSLPEEDRDEETPFEVQQAEDLAEDDRY